MQQQSQCSKSVHLPQPWLFTTSCAKNDVYHVGFLKKVLDLQVYVAQRTPASHR